MSQRKQFICYMHQSADDVSDIYSKGRNGLIKVCWQDTEELNLRAEGPYTFYWAMESHITRLLNSADHA
jgi:hypothetical protein